MTEQTYGHTQWYIPSPSAGSEDARWGWEFLLGCVGHCQNLYICHIVVLQDFRRYEVLCVLPLKSVHGEGIVGYKYEYVQELWVGFCCLTDIEVLCCCENFEESVGAIFEEIGLVLGVLDGVIVSVREPVDSWRFCFLLIGIDVNEKSAIYLT